MKHLITFVFLFCILAASAQDVKIIGPKRNTNNEVKANQNRQNSSNTKMSSAQKEQNVTLPNSIPSYSKAADFYRLAMQGDKDSMYKLGKSFLNKENGVNRDEDQAYYWLNKATELGHANAMANLADCYYNGWGCEKNYNQAFYWCKKSAELGDPYGCNNLGFYYEQGIGTSVNTQLGASWYLKSAEAGYPTAQLYRVSKI